MKPRERKHDFQTMRSETGGLIARWAREQWTHAHMLEERQRRLFDCSAWQRLTSAHKAELLGMLRGAVEAFHASGAVVWTHLHNGAPIPTEAFAKLGVSYSELDPELSLHRWANTMRPFGDE